MSFKTLGLDIGNHFTKTSEGIKIRSAVSTNYDASYKRGVVKLIRGDRKVLVGDEKGTSFRKVNKFDDDNYIDCLLTAIALSFPDDSNIDVKLALGIPVEHYDNYKKICIDKAKELGKQEIIVNGETKHINILDAIVFPQSAILGDRTDEATLPALVLDFGGGTFDISVWNVAIDGNNRYFVKEAGKSYNDGFNDVLKGYTKDLEVRHDLKLNETEAIQSLAQDVYSGGLYGDIEIKEVRDENLGGYIKSLYDQLIEDGIPFKACRSAYGIGGCAEVLKQYLTNKDFGFGLPEDKLIIGKYPQFTNARVFGELAKIYFGTEVGTEVVISQSEVAATGANQTIGVE